MSRVTALTACNDFLYAGLENGVILHINCSDGSVSSFLSAYDRAVFSLSILNPPKQKVKQLSAPKHRRSYENVELPISRIRRPQLRKGYSIKHSTTGNQLLLSVGSGFHGIVGSHENHPENFILPASTSAMQNTKPAKPNASSSYLLVWSTERGEQEINKQNASKINGDTV